SSFSRCRHGCGGAMSSPLRTTVVQTGVSLFPASCYVVAASDGSCVSGGFWWLSVLEALSSFEIRWYCSVLLTRKGLLLLTRKGCVTDVLDSSYDLGLLRSAGLKASGLPLLWYRLLIRLCPSDCSRIVFLERAFIPAACSRGYWVVSI
ncbi:hypothetical protein L195_g050228, partial [Trifolium pratense]